MADSIFISAGDPSGDNALSRVIEELNTAHSNLTYFGLGGKRSHKLGQEQFADQEDLAVIGFWEVAKKYLFFRKLLNQCLKEIKSRKPTVVILVDYPGFNLRLAKKIKELGIPIIYYISPQIWAWGKKRIVEIKKNIDLMIPILPFEEKFYKDSGINVKYAGHYLTEDIKPDYIASVIPENGHLALLPGSRKQEIERMLPVMLQTAEAVYAEYKIKSVIAGVENLFEYETLIQNKDFVSVIYDDSRKVVHDSKLVVTASGTATLEIGLIGRPMVIIYKTGTLTYQIAKRVVTLKSIGLVNLVLGENILPELIQNEATEKNITAALAKFLTDETYRNECVAKLHLLPALLGAKDVSKNIAGFIGEYL